MTPMPIPREQQQDIVEVFALRLREMADSWIEHLPAAMCVKLADELRQLADTLDRDGETIN